MFNCARSIAITPTYEILAFDDPSNYQIINHVFLAVIATRESRWLIYNAYNYFKEEVAPFGCDRPEKWNVAIPRYVTAAFFCRPIKIQRMLSSSCAGNPKKKEDSASFSQVHCSWVCDQQNLNLSIFFFFFFPRTWLELMTISVVTEKNSPATFLSSPSVSKEEEKKADPGGEVILFGDNAQSLLTIYRKLRRKLCMLVSVYFYIRHFSPRGRFTEVNILIQGGPLRSIVLSNDFAWGRR